MLHKVFSILFKWGTLGELLSSFVPGLPFVLVAGVVHSPCWAVISSKKHSGCRNTPACPLWLRTSPSLDRRVQKH